MEEESVYLPEEFDLICRLSNYRAQLEEELGDHSLLFIKTSPGLFLYELCQALGLNADDCEWVLGDKLGNEICQLMPEALELVAE
jgi:hypothetical protein